MEGKEWRAHLLRVPLSYRMGPQESAIPPAADIKRRRHVRNLRQLHAKTPQQASRVSADGDAGPDFAELGILLENLYGYRLLQEAGCEGKATYPPADNGNLTRADHGCSLRTATESPIRSAQPPSLIHRGASGAPLVRVEADGHRLVFALESANVAEVVAGLAGLATLRDISIVEPDIEEVVARLYRAPTEVG